MGRIRQIGRLDSRMMYRFDVCDDGPRGRGGWNYVLTFCCSEDSSASPGSDFWTTDVVFSNQDFAPLNNREDYECLWETGDEPLGEEGPGELEDYGIWLRHSLDAERASLVPDLVDAFYRY